MRHFLLTLKWTLLIILLTPIALYLTLLLINIGDAAPSEQSQRYLTQITNIDSTLIQNGNDNAYIFALGFASAEGKSPMTIGLQRLQKLQSQDILSDDDPQQHTLPKLPLENCLAEDNFIATCSANLRKEANLKTFLSNNRWLINRYQQLLQLNSWQDSPSFNADIRAVPFKELLLAQKLYLLDAYQNLNSSSAEVTAQAIELDMIFWQKLSTSTYILINKMASSAAISVNMKLGEVILTQGKAEASDATLPTSWKKPIALEVQSLNKTKLGEWSYFTRTITSVQADDASADTASQIASRLLSPLMQNQDTANRYAAILTNSGIQTDCDKGLSIDGISSYIYNPLGKYILCTGMPSFNAHQMTLDKLEQQRQAVVTRLER